MFWFPDLRRSIVELLLSETASPAELCRRYNIASGQFYIWKNQYAQGRLDPEPSREVELEAENKELKAEIRALQESRQGPGGKDSKQRPPSLYNLLDDRGMGAYGRVN